MPAAQLAPLVLLVDDSQEIREVYGMTLRAVGLRVALASDGAEAVRLAEALRPAVIVMDVNMPGLDGLSAARQLRQDPRTRSVPIILATSDPLQEQARSAGCAFLEKPCSLLALLKAVQAQLGA